MADVIKLVQNSTVRGEDATATVIAFLRKYADMIESGDEGPAHKAVLVLYEDREDAFCVRSRFCNATTMERAALFAMAAHDSLDHND